MTRRLVLEEGSARVEVDLDHGGRVASLSVWGLELLRGPAADRGPLDWGMYPMAPFAGRVRRGRFSFDGKRYDLPTNFGHHAIHGVTFDRPWEDEGDGVLSCPLGDPWPFGGRVVQRLRLRRDGLYLFLEVHADPDGPHGGPMPATCGWHPWWNRQLGRGRPLEVSLEALWLWPRDADGIPTGERVPAPPLEERAGRWDDCFGDVVRPPVLRWPGAVALTVESNCPAVVVFDEPDDAICVEPQTAPPDGLNLSPAVVEPGRPLVAEAVLRWEPA